jgi:diguanylate cyclase (GGDEF)-like protein
MTGLLNRNSFHVALDQATARAKRNKRPFGLLFIDLDHFKAVNDTLGHEAGDELLKEVAHRLKDTIRKSDSAYRLAGDEFTVLVEGLDSEADVFLVAEKLCEVLARPYFNDQQAPQVSASIGAVVYPRDGATPDELLSLADKAMYQAKAQGRNKATLYQPILPS